jgi:nucleolar protein 14
MEELDKSFTSLVQSQALSSLTEPGKMNALKALVNKDIPNEHVKKDELPVIQKPETFKQVFSFIRFLILKSLFKLLNLIAS